MRAVAEAKLAVEAAEKILGDLLAGMGGGVRADKIPMSRALEAALANLNEARAKLADLELALGSTR